MGSDTRFTQTKTGTDPDRNTQNTPVHLVHFSLHKTNNASISPAKQSVGYQALINTA